LGEKLNILRVHGGFPKYYHKVIGGNFRLDALQAAIINVKLPYLDSWSEKRRQNAADYTALFKEAGLAEEEGKLNFDSNNKILLPKPVYKSSGVKNYHIYNQYIIRAENRDALRKYLTDNSIGSEIYYPVPFHLQECFSNLNYKLNDFPLAEAVANTTVALPIFPELTKDQIKFVVQKIKEFTNN
jgi:dTDP-4-amino-4,6-dideoxygalactose transaminase